MVFDERGKPQHTYLDIDLGVMRCACWRPQVVVCLDRWRPISAPASLTCTRSRPPPLARFGHARTPLGIPRPNQPAPSPETSTWQHTGARLRAGLPRLRRTPRLARLTIYFCYRSYRLQLPPKQESLPFFVLLHRRRHPWTSRARARFLRYSYSHVGPWACQRQT